MRRRIPYMTSIVFCLTALVLASTAAAIRFDLIVEAQKDVNSDTTRIVFELGRLVTFPWNIIAMLVILLLLLLFYNMIVTPLLSPRYGSRKAEKVTFDDIRIKGKSSEPNQKGLSTSESKEVLREISILQRKITSGKSYSDEKENDEWKLVEEELNEEEE